MSQFYICPVAANPQDYGGPHNKESFISERMQKKEDGRKDVSFLELDSYEMMPVEPSQTTRKRVSTSPVTHSVRFQESTNTDILNRSSAMRKIRRAKFAPSNSINWDNNETSHSSPIPFASTQNVGQHSDPDFLPNSFPNATQVIQKYHISSPKREGGLVPSLDRIQSVSLSHVDDTVDMTTIEEVYHRSEKRMPQLTKRYATSPTPKTLPPGSKNFTTVPTNISRTTATLPSNSEEGYGDRVADQHLRISTCGFNNQTHLNSPLPCGEVQQIHRHIAPSHADKSSQVPHAADCLNHQNNHATIAQCPPLQRCHSCLGEVNERSNRDNVSSKRAFSNDHTSCSCHCTKASASPPALPKFSTSLCNSCNHSAAERTPSKKASDIPETSMSALHSSNAFGGQYLPQLPSPHSPFPNPFYNPLGWGIPGVPTHAMIPSHFSSNPFLPSIPMGLSTYGHPMQYPMSYNMFAYPHRGFPTSGMNNPGTIIQQEQSEKPEQDKNQESSKSEETDSPQGNRKGTDAELDIGKGSKSLPNYPSAADAAKIPDGNKSKHTRKMAISAALNAALRALNSMQGRPSRAQSRTVNFSPKTGDVNTLLTSPFSYTSSISMAPVIPSLDMFPDLFTQAQNMYASMENKHIIEATNTTHREMSNIHLEIRLFNYHHAVKYSNRLKWTGTRNPPRFPCGAQTGQRDTVETGRHSGTFIHSLTDLSAVDPHTLPLSQHQSTERRRTLLCPHGNEYFQSLRLTSVPATCTTKDLEKLVIEQFFGWMSAHIVKNWQLAFFLSSKYSSDYYPSLPSFGTSKGESDISHSTKPVLLLIPLLDQDPIVQIALSHSNEIDPCRLLSEESHFAKGADTSIRTREIVLYCCLLHHSHTI